MITRSKIAEHLASAIAQVSTNPYVITLLLIPIVKVGSTSGARRCVLANAGVDVYKRQVAVQVLLEGISTGSFLPWRA